MGSFRHIFWRNLRPITRRSGRPAVVAEGAAALIPLPDFCSAKDSNCAALIDQGGSDAGVKQGDIVTP